MISNIEIRKCTRNENLIFQDCLPSPTFFSAAFSILKYKMLIVVEVLNSCMYVFWPISKCGLSVAKGQRKKAEKVICLMPTSKIMVEAKWKGTFLIYSLNLAYPNLCYTNSQVKLPFWKQHNKLFFKREIMVIWSLLPCDRNDFSFNLGFHEWYLFSLSFFSNQMTVWRKWSRTQSHSSKAERRNIRKPLTKLRWGKNNICQVWQQEKHKLPSSYQIWSLQASIIIIIDIAQCKCHGLEKLDGNGKKKNNNERKQSAKEKRLLKRGKNENQCVLYLDKLPTGTCQLVYTMHNVVWFWPKIMYKPTSDLFGISLLKQNLHWYNVWTLRIPKAFV